MNIQELLEGLNKIIETKVQEFNNIEKKLSGLSESHDDWEIIAEESWSAERDLERLYDARAILKRMKV